jgi:hypothetical protein
MSAVLDPIIMGTATMHRALPAAVVFAALVSTAVSAHHGSAAYHTDREVTVAGHVVEWRWTQPHTWVVLSAPRPGGDERWELEGPPLSWAQQRNWTATTLRAGESVQITVYPARAEPHGGLIKRIVRANGETLPVSRPWLDRP